MTRFKKCMELAYRAYLIIDAAVTVVLLLVIAGIFIFINVQGFTSGNGAELSIVIVIDVLCLLLGLVGIDDWLDERDRKKSGLSREEFYGRIAIH